MLLFLLSSSIVWLPALLRGSHRKGKRGEKESWLSSSGSLLSLHCFPRRLQLQIPGAHRYRWGGSAYDELIVRFAITWGREALNCQTENKRINTYTLDMVSYQWRNATQLSFSFALHRLITAAFIPLILLFCSLWRRCRYSCPQKSPDTDLDQVDKSLPPSICHTGSFPGTKGQMERDSFLGSPFPLCLRMCYMLNVMWRALKAHWVLLWEAGTQRSSAT